MTMTTIADPMDAQAGDLVTIEIAGATITGPLVAHPTRPECLYVAGVMFKGAGQVGWTVRRADSVTIERPTQVPTALIVMDCDGDYWVRLADGRYVRINYGGLSQTSQLALDPEGDHVESAEYIARLYSPIVEVVA